MTGVIVRNLIPGAKHLEEYFFLHEILLRRKLILKISSLRARFAKNS